MSARTYSTARTSMPNWSLRRCAWCGRPLRNLIYIGKNGPFGPTCAKRFAAARDEERREYSTDDRPNTGIPLINLDLT